MKIIRKAWWFILRDDVERVSINMEALDFGVIILEYNLNKSPVRCVDDRASHTGRSTVNRSWWEIHLINSFDPMLIRKPHGRAWIQKRNTVKRSTKWTINYGRRHASKNVCACDIYLPVVIWSLWIRTSSTRRCVLPAHMTKKKKNQDLHLYTLAWESFVRHYLMALCWFITVQGWETSVNGTGRGPEAGPLEFE